MQGVVTDEEFPSNVEFTIFTGPELLRDRYRMLHGRMTDIIGFELPITDDGIEELLKAEGSDYTPGREMPATSVPGAIHAAVVEALPEYAEPRYFEADSGRGASGYAVALELDCYVADVGGAGTALWVSALGVRRLYERLRKAMGRRPLASMGTAVYLAAADLSERIGTSDFNLHGRGDTRTDSPDASYAGDDQRPGARPLSGSAADARHARRVALSNSFHTWLASVVIEPRAPLRASSYSTSREGIR